MVWRNETQDAGETNFPDQILGRGAQWGILGGGLKYLIAQATFLADKGSCDAAFAATLVCQRDNSDARTVIQDAGSTNDCSYLKKNIKPWV